MEVAWPREEIRQMEPFEVQATILNEEVARLMADLHML